MTLRRALLAAMLLATPAVAQPFIIPLNKQNPPEPAPNPSPVPVAPPQSQPTVSGSGNAASSTPAAPSADRQSGEAGATPSQTQQPSR
jgi:hypothetical protein